jgi:non-specific serine/threonine protein kinase
LEQGLAVFRALQDLRGIALTLGHLGAVVNDQGDHDSAVGFYEESLRGARELQDRQAIAISLAGLGLAAQGKGDKAQAQALLEQSLAIQTELHDERGVAHNLINLGVVALEQGDYARAQGLALESLQRFRDLGEQGGIAECVEVLMGVAVEQGRSRAVVRLAAASESIRRGINAPLLGAARTRYENILKRARAQLDDQSCTMAWSEGAEMGVEQATGYALEALNLPEAKQAVDAAGISGHASINPGAGQPPTLTQRETEIVCLVAQGLTDRDIASRLAISPRTVDTHLRRIFSKVHVTSRAGLAAWAVRHNLPVQSPGTT